MLDSGNNESTDIETKFSLPMKGSNDDFDARGSTSESLTLTTVISYLMVHSVPCDHSSNIQKIKEEVLGISQKSNKSLATHSNIHGSYCNKMSVYSSSHLY